MGVLDILYTLLIMPLQLTFEVLYMVTNKVIGNPGLSIIALSLMMNFLVLPLYMRADAMQEHERDMENRLRDGVAHIKKVFKGDERMMILQTYYRQNDYKPTDVFKGSVSLFLEIPFFISAYMFLSHLELIQGVPFGIIPDLGSPDGLLAIGGFSVNVLPFVMTGINLVSCMLFTKGMPRKTKVQLYGMALFFLVFLYASPAGLVFYWTLNNVFALVKTIFYKLKNPKKVLIVLFAVAGLAILSYGLFVYTGHGFKKQLLVIVFGSACLLPLVVTAIKRFVKLPAIGGDRKPSKRAFAAAAVFMAVLTGLLIPSAVISSSPQEFLNVFNFVSPVWFVVSATCLSVGTFCIWFGVFYWLCNEKAKVVFETSMWILCAIATVNYMFFGLDLGVISSALKFDSNPSFSQAEMMKNIGILVAVAVVCIVLAVKAQKAVPTILALAIVAFTGMSALNLSAIVSSVEEARSSAVDAQSSSPRFNLSKTGQNVVVIMLDRAMGGYVPYILNEKPELKESFDGFTHYENVISYGAFTNVGTPALFGGYEYTPYEMNSRSEESLESKQNEALRVMPVLFEENGFDVTVCDPTYAGYQWTSDLSIYDDYPDIHTYHAMGAFSDSPEAVVENNKRNFFCYSIMKCAPLCLQNALYARGSYNSSKSTGSYGVQQVSDDNMKSEGITGGFMDPFTTLQNLPTMTRIVDGSTNTFVMMTNDATHNPMLLQEPDYAPSLYVDNSKFEQGGYKREKADGTPLAMETTDQIIHYQANVASLTQVAKWVDFLKENDVYDNTRIILVADHGTRWKQIPGMQMDYGDRGEYDMEFYYPLLMVKDFNASGFSYSEEFMSNADVPVIAFSGLVDSPVNPATGKAITNSEKTAHDQYVYFSGNYDVRTNNGNTFDPDGKWFTVHDDMRLKENWTEISDPIGK